MGRGFGGEDPSTAAKSPRSCAGSRSDSVATIGVRASRGFSVMEQKISDQPHAAPPSNEGSTQRPPQPAYVPPGGGLTAEQQARIKERLAEKGAVAPCPRCGQPEFALINNGILKPAIQDTSDNVVSSGVTIPSVITVCVQCGFLSIHALGTIGFLRSGKVEI
jgi:hypothetical protein